MMKKRVITSALVFALAASVPALAIFGIPSPEDLLIWFVLRPIMHGNQRAMIANQVQELQKLVVQLQTARNQLTQVTDSVQGLVGSITAPMAELVATPTDLLNTTRAWHSDFTGQAGKMVDSLRGLAANGESVSRSWRDVLQAVDTVTAADIRNVYQGGADDAVRTFQRRSNYADRSLEYAGARADAGADLMQIHAATTGAIGRIGERGRCGSGFRCTESLHGGAHRGRCPRITRTNPNPNRNWTQPGPRRNRRRGGPLSSRGTPQGDRGPAPGQPCRSRSAVGSGEGGRGRTGQRTD